MGEYEQNDSWPLHEGHLDQRQSRIKTLENHENKVTASCDVKKKKKMPFCTWRLPSTNSIDIISLNKLITE